jgi:hypothetical protein
MNHEGDKCEAIEKSGGKGIERRGGKKKKKKNKKKKRRRRRRRRKAAMRTNGQAVCWDSRSGSCGSAELRLRATVCGLATLQA